MDKIRTKRNLLEQASLLARARRVSLRRVHRVDVTLQKPFDHETGQLYDPDNHRKAD
ncbi:hypothetical protein [Andreprevotia chitinilytica]|uniref:hypothetical protein n=1 Tax=Andreprevotia chitinilytica TaxID=396808 RepID=UPI0012EB74AB|nr:hypothetical protein [Andreprevotia chitinilytica]